VRGRRGLHLQCHIGTDTLSLARLGATMTGLDFSAHAHALAEARALAARTAADIAYVEAAVDDATTVLVPGSFDFVFTGIGALCWLPDIRSWARTVATLLAPGGDLFLREGHPMLSTLDETKGEDLIVAYPYFETAEPTVFDAPGTYVATDHELQHTRTAQWSHGLGEVVTALLDAGMRLTMLEEHRSVPWEALWDRMVRSEDGEWRLAEHGEQVPLSYTLRAVKEG